MTAKTKLAGIYRSTRIEITAAFVVPVVMLGIACAVATGKPLAWGNLIPGAGVILCLLFKSNILNNLIDIDVDKHAMEQGSRKSGMYHTIILGELTPLEAFGLYISCLVMFAFFSWWLAVETGIIVLAFTMFGFLMSLQYNLPPLKLAYRPFPELTMLLPATIVAVAGVQYILVSQVTMLGLFMGASFGLFSAAWFLFQSLIDYEVDKEAGKNTTPVYMGPINATAVGILYPVLGIALLTVGVVSCGLPLERPVILAMACTAVLGAMLVYHAQHSFKMWRAAMFMAVVFGSASAIAIVM